jgi:flagellar biosynthesis protein FliR
MLLPGFSSARVPMQIRVLLVLALSAAILPLSGPLRLTGPVTEPLQIASLLAGETFIGAMLAASVRIFVLAVGFFITAASAAIGLSGQIGASMIDTDAEPALATLMSMTTLLTLFALDFHHPVIAALAASYDLVPIGANIDPSVSAKQIVRMLTEGFSNVFRLASPFLTFALLMNVSIALINKLAPNLQVYFIAAPAVIVGGILLGGFVVPVLLPMSLEAISASLRLP